MKSITSLEEPLQSVSEFYNSTIFLDKTTKSKIQRHLTDINDVITEEDIRNIDTSITLKEHPAAAVPRIFGMHK